MTTQYLKLSKSKEQQLNITFSAQQKNLFLRGFYILCSVSFWIIMTANANLISIFGALIVAISALVPSYLWCCNKAKGLPLFPLLALNYLFTHGFPLVSSNAAVNKYSPTEHLVSSLIVASFLAVSTMCWFFYVKNDKSNFGRLKKFGTRQIFPFFICALIGGVVYRIFQDSGFLWLVMPYPGLISAMKTTSYSLNSFSMIILGYLMGSKTLNRLQLWIFIIVAATLIYITGASLYLSTTGLYIVFASVGWMLAVKKIPWRLLLVSFMILAFLHLGKGATRNYYWNYRETGVKPSEYAQVYRYWIHNSIEKIQQPTKDSSHQINVAEEKGGTLVYRSSVVQMLLKVQAETGKDKPYLWGKTYAIIPQLLVPRFIDSDKIRGGEANHILSIHYGLQSYRQTMKTSIGWGILQEAYANFGWLGCLSLGVFIGNLYGWVTRWSMNVSSLSFRFLIALMFMILAFKAEITMGIFVVVVVRGFILLSAIRILFMKSGSNTPTILKSQVTQQSS